MNRRQLLAAAGASCVAGLLARPAWAQSAANYAVPPRFVRPDIASDEGGLWAMMDREEKSLRRSPLVLRDADLKAYVEGIACRLGADHCADIRVFLVRTPLFNANMAPNGMIQIWTGLLLRMENEAQLAAVIGHEIGHYLQRHSLERLRDIKSKAAFGQVLGLLGLVGAVGQVAVLASAYAYGREHENEADRIGAFLMHQAGYDVAESAKVWENLLQEAQARDGAEPDKSSPLFATHPAPPERRDALEQLAKALPGGTKGSAAYAAHTARFLDEWLQDEVKRGQYAESLVLLTRLIASGTASALASYYRGEAYRLRGGADDQELALADYRTSAADPNPPAQAFRGIGLIARQRGQRAEAAQAFARYLELAPDAPDSAFIKVYISELS
ncbi:MAG: M48 family metallopeptidase [Rhodocyclaceae bacterium]|nr:M48 family metallopeptidase [Rhodocyclaceae bacterium]